jgi:hypothetical protein
MGDGAARVFQMKIAPAAGQAVIAHENLLGHILSSVFQKLIMRLL